MGNLLIILRNFVIDEKNFDTLKFMKEQGISIATYLFNLVLVLHFFFLTNIFSSFKKEGAH